MTTTQQKIHLSETHAHKSHQKKIISPTQKAFNLWGLIVIAWALYRSTIGVGAPVAFDEFVFKPIVFLLPVVYYVVNIEKKTLQAGLWLTFKNLKQDLSTSILISLPLIAFTLFITFTKGTQHTFESILMIACLSIAIAVTEETLSRGFVARHIWDETKSFTKTFLQASLLHIFLRIPRIMTTPELFGQKLVYFFVADLILSFVLTSVFIYRKSLLEVYILRFATTFLQILIMT